MNELTPFTLPRGIRNHNPGNLKSTLMKPWIGSSGLDSDGFVVFVNPVFGLRAIMRTLAVYRVVHRIFFLKDIIFRYAPAGENNPETYLEDVLRRTCFSADQPLNTVGDVLRVVDAIVWQENGQNPYSLAEYRAASFLAQNAFPSLTDLWRYKL